MATATPSKEITDIALREDTIAQVAKIDSVTHQAALTLASKQALESNLYRGIVLAKARLALRSLMTPDIMAALMGLAGSKAGFLIDRPEKYTNDEVREILMDAMLRGLSPCGNEINIIGGNLYATKEAFQRLLSDLGVRYSVQIGNAAIIQGDATCRYFDAAASYRWRGETGRLSFAKTDDLDSRIAVKFNSTDGPDTLRGKAESKLLRRLYQHLTKQSLPTIGDSDGEIDGEVISSQKFDPEGLPE
jgi:hypothetical protein